MDPFSTLLFPSRVEKAETVISVHRDDARLIKQATTYGVCVVLCGSYFSIDRDPVMRENANRVNFLVYKCCLVNVSSPLCATTPYKVGAVFR